MNVLMISPGYPAEMVFFARGLAAAGASVIGVGDQPAGSVPAIARDALDAYSILIRESRTQRASGGSG